MERWKSMERLTRDNDVPANSNPAQVLYSFDLHGPSSNEQSAQLAIVLGPEQYVDASRGVSQGRWKSEVRACKKLTTSTRFR